MATVRLECFGKLPGHGDFVRVNAGPELLALDGWLQAGLLATRGRPDWGAAWPATPSVRLARRAASGRTLAAVLVPSRDAAGRDFPLVVGGVLEGREVARRPELAPLVAEPLLAVAEAVAAWGRAGRTLREVQAEVERLTVEVDAGAAERRLAEALAATTLEQLVASAVGAWDDRRHQLVANAVSLLGPRARPRFALAVPSPGDGAAVAVWLALVVALRGGAADPPLVTWSQDPRGAAAGLRLVLVEPQGEHFLPLALRHLPSDACDLAHDGAGDPALVERARERFGALTSDPTARLAEVVPRLAAAAAR